MQAGPCDPGLPTWGEAQGPALESCVTYGGGCVWVHSFRNVEVLGVGGLWYDLLIVWQHQCLPPVN